MAAAYLCCCFFLICLLSFTIFTCFSLLIVFPLNQDEFITEQQAKELTREDKGAVDILEARIGLEGDTPIWEISYKQKNL